MEAPYRQRLRIKFAKVGQTRWIGHLDLARAWERGLNRAKIPMAYTQGFNRRPRMQFANALPLGYTSECEIVDLWLREQMEPAVAKAQIVEKMAPGIVLAHVEEVYVRQPSLPSLTVQASYHIELPTKPLDTAALQERVDNLMAAEEIMREKRGRKNKGKLYDLRPLILSVTVVGDGDLPGLDVVVSAKEGAMGRPDELLSALELDPLSARVHRTALQLDEERLISADKK